MAVLIAAALTSIGSAPAGAASAQKGKLSFSTGVDFTNGDYQTSRSTSILYVPTSVKYEYGPFTAKLTVPFIRIEGPGGVVGGTGGGLVVGTGAVKRTINAGVGDIVASGSYLLPKLGENLPYLELTGKVKFPSANDSDGLGTGRYDYSFQLDSFQSFGSFTPFATFGFRVIGEPQGTRLDNKFFGSLGLGYRVTDRASAGLIWDWQQTASPRTGDSHELVPYVSWKLSQHMKLGPYASLGLSPAAPDYGLGFQLTFTP